MTRALRDRDNEWAVRGLTAPVVSAHIGSARVARACAGSSGSRCLEEEITREQEARLDRRQCRSGADVGGMWWRRYRKQLRQREQRERGGPVDRRLDADRDLGALDRRRR